MRKLLCCLVAAAGLVALSGCDQGPSQQVLAGDLTRRLNENYTPGLFEVADVAAEEPAPAARLDIAHAIVPFTITLKLKRDHDFGAWDQANANTLLQILGGRPEAMSGLKSGGNKTGDVIRIAGVAAYRKARNGWQLESNEPPLAAAEPEAPSRTSVARRLGQLFLTTARVMATPSRAPEVDSELTATIARLAHLDSGFAVASGPVGSDDWLLTEAARIEKQGSTTPVINIATSGTVENLNLLRDGKITAAIVQNNEAAMAASGDGPFARTGTFPALRVDASLFPMPVHVIVMAASTVASVSELVGKKIAVAATGPAAVSEATDILRAHRVATASLAAAPEALATAKALAAVEKGELDALVITAAAPSPDVQAFARGHSIRFLPLDGDAIALMTAGNSNYIAMTVPAQTYPGQTKPIATIAVTAQLVSLQTVPASEVGALLQIMFKEVDYLGHGSALGSLVSARSARNGLTLPLHPGAEAFFDSTTRVPAPK
ncbi:MAG: TAXI family TRAP transporter solute-binding subunit [Rhodospirillaceae bacterium]|nr:TAXI family TRAP transporter solute-binding subunit [Rhodospirillaceae bacterium]